VVEYAPSNEPDASKRRSTRIVQAVPLTVTGVDALGQPFRERTSTLIINCHGFKYQSKHYVLKGTSLEVEIPHPESGEPPRKVRGSVTFVQRPRTVKELFQVGVELDVSGNVWGVAFPPDDWFPYGEAPEGEVAHPAAPAAAPSPVAEVASAHPTAPVLPAEPAPGVRTMPAPAEISAGVARQVSTMLADAQEQIQRMVREASSAAVAKETANLLRDLNVQLRAAAERAVEQAASGYVDQVVKRALEKVEETWETSAKELRATWAGEFEKDLRDSSQHLLAKLAELGETFRADFSRQVQEDTNAAAERLAQINAQMREIHQQVAANADTIPTLIEAARNEMNALAEESRQKWGAELGSHTEKGLSRLAELEEAAKKLNAQIHAASDAALSGWRQQLEKDLAEAAAQLDKTMETKFASAEHLLQERVNEAATKAATKAQEEWKQLAGELRSLVEAGASELSQKVAEVKGGIEAVVTDAQGRLAGLRTSIEEELTRGRACAAEIEVAAARVTEHSRKLDELAQKAGEEVARRFEAMLMENSEMFKRRAEGMLAELAANLKPALDAQGAAMVKRVAAEVEKKVAPHLERTEATIGKLAELEKVAAETLRTEQARLEREFEQASRSVLAKFMEDLEGKTTEAAHTTFEQLYKSAEWYQRKAQTSMQSAFEKGMAQATTHLREKAAEISTLFASELDHYSRSYTEHTQGLLEEAAKELTARLRRQLGETMETTAAQFGDETHRIAEEKVQHIREASSGVERESRERLLTQMEAICKQLDGHAIHAAAEFQQRLSDRLRQGVSEAQQDLQAHLAPVLESWRAETKSNQEQWLKTLERYGGESVDLYKQRLENVSNSWMVAAVTTLSQHSQGVLDALAKAVEQRLREICADVFSGVGESMRQRLAGLSSDLKSEKGSG